MRARSSIEQDSRAEGYHRHLLGKTVCLSFQTVAELYQWAELRGWGNRRRAEMDAWLRRFVVLPYDDATARAWARIRASGKQRGRPITAQDAWVAAIAVRHGCPLVTHNAAHYADVEGLSVLTAQSSGRGFVTTPPGTPPHAGTAGTPRA